MGQGSQLPQATSLGQFLCRDCSGQLLSHVGHFCDILPVCPRAITQTFTFALPSSWKNHIASGSQFCYLCLKCSSSQHSEDTNGMQILVESLRGPHSPTYKVLNKMQ